MVLPLVAAAPYITGGIATLGAGMYAAQPYIQKAVDDYINRSVTPTGEGLVIGGGPKEEIKTEVKANGTADDLGTFSIGNVKD